MFSNLIGRVPNKLWFVESFESCWPRQQSKAIKDQIVELDNTVISIWDNSLVNIFHVYSDLYLYSFPYIWYPIKEMSKYSKLFSPLFSSLDLKIFFLIIREYSVKSVLNST